jgi:RimJ/RimL family protein N-acetyltransferase
LRTGRLTVRRFRPGDAAAMRSVLCDPEVMRGLTPLHPDAVPPWLAREIAAYAQRPGLGRWAVVREGAVIGYGALFREPPRHGPGEAEIGYRLAQAAWRRGLGTELARGLIEHGLEILGLARIVALIDPANPASARVAEKAGMLEAGQIMLPWYDHPDRLFEIRAGGN